MSQGEIFENLRSEDTLESLYAAHGPQSRGFYWTLLIGVLGGLLALPLLKVDVTVRAAGWLRPVAERTAVRPAVSGYIVKLYVRDNERVESGQALVQLQSDDVEERIKRNKQAQAERRKLVTDLISLTSISPTSLFNSQVSLHGEMKAARFEEQRKKFDYLTLQTAALRQECSALAVELSSDELAEMKAKTQLARYESLAAKGLVSQQDFENIRFEYEHLEKESKLLIEQAYSRWESRLHDEGETLADLVTDGQRLDEELTHYTLRAPERGVLIGFTGLSEGSFVALGQALGEVSPADELKVEAFVMPRDIGLIHNGQAVRLQVDAFPYSHWGVVSGIVESISGDMLIGDNTSPVTSGTYFKVTVRPETSIVRLPNGTVGELRKGMTLSARFLVARRSLLEILYQDMSDWLDPKANSTG